MVHILRYLNFSGFVLHFTGVKVNAYFDLHLINRVVD